MLTIERRGWRRRSIRRTALIAGGWIAGTLLFLICALVISQQTIWLFVWDAPQQAVRLLGRMFPPNWPYINRLWKPIWDTVNIATLGTLLGLLVATPLAFLAARNTTFHSWGRRLALVLIVTSRSVNSLIWALMLVTILGPGVLAGTLAIGIRSIGFLGKLLYEAIEEIDPRQVEAVRATGAGPGSLLVYGILPQIMPALLGTAVYRWDINIRESTVVGLVGAGGIGLFLNSSILGLRWADAVIIFFFILAMVVMSEWVSARVRRHLI